MKMPIRNVIFDLGRVLLNLNVEATLQAFCRSGFTSAPEMLSRNLRSELFGAYECGDTSTEEFRQAIQKECSAPLTDRQTDDIWNAMLAGIPSEKLQLLVRLRKDYKVCLLSNTNAMHWDYIVQHFFQPQGFTPQQCFDHVFLSFEMSCKKPDPAIYLKALEKGGMKAEETLFIDDLAENCQAAAGTGIHTAHYQPGEPLEKVLRPFLPNL